MTASERSYDAVVIGGGLAGAAVSTKLSREGRNILLLEKETVAHHKVCGEFISYEAQRYLADLGIDLQETGAALVDHIRLVHGNRGLTARLGFQAASLSRLRLDDAVLNAAVSAGTEVRVGVTVTDAQRMGDVWRVSCQNKENVFAKTVFLATGKHDIRVWSQRSGKQNDYIGFKMHLTLSESARSALVGKVLIALYKGGYAGLELIESGKANLCLVVTKSIYASLGKSWEMLIKYLKASSSELSFYLTDAEPCQSWDKPLAIYGIPYGYVFSPSRDDPPDFFRLGDQMAVIPSLCGDGMAIALHTAFLAAKFYLGSDARSYHQIANRQLAPQINRATLMARALSLSPIQKLILPICGAMPRLITNAIHSTRIQQLSGECGA